MARKKRKAKFRDKVRALEARGFSEESARAIAGAMTAKKREKKKIGQALRKRLGR